MSRIRLTWNNASTTIVEQRVYRSISPLDIDDMPEPLAVLPRRNREYLDSTIEDGLTYYYAVSSVLPDYSELISEEIKVEASPGGSDPHWDNVVSLLHFEGLPGSSNFIDQRGVVWSSGGAARLSGDQFKFGEGSLELDGSPSWIQAPPDAGLFGGSDFTVEMQVFPQSVSGGYATLAGVWDGATGGRVWVIYQVGSNLVFEYSTTGSNNFTVTSTGVLLLAQDWSHIAVCRSGSVIRIFIRGQLAGEAQIGSRVLRDATSRPLSIGYLPPPVSFGVFNGYVDEFRLTKGVARYTENFVPPTEAFPNN